MLKNKKAQGLSLNTVIIAAIVLIVLVILVMVFTGRMGFFTRGLWNQTGGKQCESDPDYTWADEESCAWNDRKLGIFSDVGEGQVCCKRTASGGTQAGTDTTGVQEN